jgi:hypothetical protein
VQELDNGKGSVVRAVAMRSWYLRPGTDQEPRRKGTSAVGSRYQETTSENLTVATSMFVIVNSKV